VTGVAGRGDANDLIVPSAFPARHPNLGSSTARRSGIGPATSRLRARRQPGWDVDRGAIGKGVMAGAGCRGRMLW